MDIRCLFGWHHWRLSQANGEVSVDGRTGWEHDLVCRRCGEQQKDVEMSFRQADHLWRYRPIGDGWDDPCDGVAPDRHGPGLDAICEHPRSHHGAWTHGGDHFTEGVCVDCHCQGFVSHEPIDDHMHRTS